jgi:catechol 2,3-dioxygenase-like lactoylglutathione lyase family enzyme
MGVAPIMRVARATDNLDAIRDMYRVGLELQVLGEFKDHQGFDGVILGHSDWRYHLEFTSKPGHRVGTAPSEEQLLVFYVPERAQWERRCQQMTAAGFRTVTAFNPYWEARGVTFEDIDGYRVVVQNDAWSR